MTTQEFLPRSQPWRSASYNDSYLDAIGSLCLSRLSPPNDLQTEKRVAEALNARDVVVQRLASACSSIRQKTILIEHLEKENIESQEKLRLFQNKASGEGETDAKVEEEIRGLQEEIKWLKIGRGQPPNYEEIVPEDTSDFDVPALPASDSLFKTADDPEERLKARHALLASLPLPTDIPSDALRPLIFPANITIHQLVAAVSHYPQKQLESYRVFDKLTTAWCPEKEEHGYFLAPAFKCVTSLRTATAHNWNVVDSITTMTKPTECFYSRDGKWYYAGLYKAVKLEDLTAAEWNNLSQETMQTLIRETVSGRKGSAPQTLYETGQLYAVGALRIACVGLQCVGFNNVLYRNVLEQAANLVQGSSGIRSGGSGWNAQARQISEIAVTAAAVGKKNPASGGGRDGKENS